MESWRRKRERAETVEMFVLPQLIFGRVVYVHYVL